MSITTLNPSTAEYVPFGQPALEGQELEYVRQAVEGGHTSSGGPFSARCSMLLADCIGAPDVLMTTSCTDALELSALLLDIEPGDTVIVPSFTFVSTALAFVRAGAKLLFCDIEPTTLGLDPAHLETLIDPSVRAVVPVHYAGVGADLAGIEAVLDSVAHPISLIEDNAHGLFGRYRDAPLGSFGRFSTLSFHETKNFVCGEGGALVLNDERDVERAHILLDKGTNRRQFMLGAVDKYSWKDNGSSFGLADVLAAYLYAQLEERERILNSRRAVFERYEAMLSPRLEEHGFTLPNVPVDREQAYHMFYVLAPDRAMRDHVMSAMNADKVKATFHYVPLHDSEAATRFSARPPECPITDDISGRLLRLPFHTHLSEATAERVVDVLFDAVRSAPGTVVRGRSVPELERVSADQRPLLKGLG